MLWSVICLVCFGVVLSAPSLESVEDIEIKENDPKEIDEKKSITVSELGDFTLLNFPISKTIGSIHFNDTQARTVSALGNAALVIGGLYLLSGFGGGLADPLGLSRRLSSGNRLIGHRASQEEEHNYNHHNYDHHDHRPGNKHHRRRRPSRPGRRPSRPSSADERQLQRPLLNFRPPTFRPLSLPTLRMPTLPSLPSFQPFRLRRPSLPSLPNPFRPRRPSRPEVRPQSAQPARPFRPSSQGPPNPALLEPVRQNLDSAEPPSRPAFRDEPILGDNNIEIEDNFNTNDYDSISPFDSDPFSEFQGQNFGDDAAFRTLLDQQFDQQFEFEKL